MRAADGGVVAVHDAIVHDEQRSTRVRNGERVLRIGLQGRIPHLEIGHLAAPKAGTAVDGHARQAALKLRRVNGAKGIGARGIVLEIGDEHGRGERGRDVVEKGLDGLRRDGVELGEGEPDEAVVVRVLHELVADGRGQLDGLARHRGAADVDRVGALGAGRAGLVAKLDVEGGALDGLEGGRFGGVEELVPGGLGGRHAGVEDPAGGRWRVNNNSIELKVSWRSFREG